MRSNKLNKINKLLIILLLFICGICINRDRVMAVSSGGSIGGAPAPGVGGSGTNGLYRVHRTLGYRVTLVKYETGSNEPPIDYYDSKTYIATDFVDQNFTLKNKLHYTTTGSKTNLLKSGGTVKWIDRSKGITRNNLPDGISIANGTEGPSYSIGNGKYPYNWTEVIEYFEQFTDSTKTKELQNYLNDVFGFNINDKSVSCEELKYYYLLIEPMQVVEKNRNEQWFGTVSELNKIDGNTGKEDIMSTYIYTPTTNFKFENINVSFDYLGSGVGDNPKGNTNIAEKNAYGVGIIWIGTITQECKKCYKVDIKKDNPVCNNNDRNNKGEYKEEYTKISCDGATSEQETNTEYGKLMNELNENCNIYCIESATASFPGGISSRMALEIVPHEGTYFAWPTMRSDSNSYTLSMTSKFTCRIVKKGNNSCDTTSLINNVKSRIESNDMQFGAQLTAGTNNKIDAESLIKDGNSEYNYSTNLKFNANGISDPLIFERKQYLKIKNDTNRYYDRENDKATSFPYYTFFDRKQGVVSLKRTDDTNNDYKLILTNIKLGLNNIFGSEDAYNYTCSYSISNNSCLCPENSPKAGFDIYSGYKYVGLTEEDLKNKTCLDLQNEFCYEKPAYYCYSETGKIDITQCVNKKIIDEGMSWDDARKKCTDEQPECQDYCIIPETGEIKDITKCLEDNDNNRTFCENTYCRSNVPCEDCCYDEGNNCEWVEEPITSSNFKKYTELKKFSFEYKDVNALKIIKAYRKDCKVDDTIYKDCEHKAFVCPDGIDGMKDPTNCFSTELSKYGYSSITDMLKEKKEYLVNKIFATCQEQVCPNGKNKKILYRVIDLNNPFPGKNGNGRKPGSNWNSTTVIENKIKKARGANGYDLYKKEPLYKITLTPDTIKEIRKYNKENDYSDFTLNCTNNNRSKCISEFIHKEIADNVEGKCKTMTDSTEFDNCYNGN